jgi:cell division protein ZapA
VAETQQRSAAEISRAELEACESGAVVVDIYDQIYQLRGSDPGYIERLASVVDCEVLTATVEANCQQAAQSAMRSRAGSLMGMLDAVLEERKAG